MPEDNNPSSGEPDGSKPKPKVRRISNKVPSKPSETPDNQSAAIVATPPATDAESGAVSPSASNVEKKRSNRRRRGKGKSSSQASGQAQETETPEPTDSSTPAPAETDPESATKDKPEPIGRPQVHQRTPQPPRRRLDPEKVAKNAWKIYLAEVSEEGVALIADNDARELARRCFRLSEIFLEEEDRRN